MSLMGWLGEKLGTTSNFKATAPTNAFNAKEAQLAQSQYGGTISAAQRAALAGPGQANQTAGMQSGLAQALMDQAAGRGPSLAQSQLRRATEANLAQGAGAIASQRGINPALAARLVSQSQGSAQQTAAGQSAELAAQEQLNARGLLAQALSAQRGQDIGQQQANTSLLSTAGGLQQGQNAVNLQNSLGVQGLNQATAAQNANLQLGAQQINAGVAGQNAAANAGLLGGLIGGAGAAMSGGATAGAAHGGEIPSRASLAAALARRRYASGGEIEIPDIRIPDYSGGGLGGQALAKGITQAAKAAGKPRAAKSKGIAGEDDELSPPPPLPEMFARGGRVQERDPEARRLPPPPPPPDYFGTKRETDLPDLRLDTYQGENVRRTHGVPLADRERFARGGPIPEPRESSSADRRRKAPEPDMGRKRDVELPDLRLDTYQGENVRRAYGVPLNSERYASGGPVDVHDFRPGGRVPGRARFPGDSPGNDTVPALVSPGEIVLPRTVTQHPEAEDRAADFVAAIRRQKMGPPSSYGEMLSRMRYLNAMADGGEVEENPSLWNRIRRWAGARPGDESTAAGRDVAEGINAALPQSVSGREAVLAQRRRLAEIDAALKE